MFKEDGANRDAVGDAGNEVAEVLGAGEGRHGFAVGLVSADVDEDWIGSTFLMGFECAVPGLATARDGRTVKFRCERDVLIAHIFG